MTKHSIIKTPGTTLQEREKYWENIIERARAYQSGVTAFCRVYHIRKENYYSWLRRLKLKHPEWDEPVPTNKNKAKAEPKFVPVVVTSEAPPEKPSKKSFAKKSGSATEQKQQKAETVAAIEVRTAQGHVITVHASVPAACLQMLLEELCKSND